MLLPDHGEELVAGDELDLAPLGKPPGILSESTRCHHETTNGPLRRHHAIEFPHDIFWLRDDVLADSDNLPPPDVIAQEIVDDLEAALEQFRLIASDLGSKEVAE